jgi:hypothetical protein
MPVAAARTAATGSLIALLAVAIAGTLGLVAVAVRATTAGDNGVRIEGPPLVLLVVGIALTSAVALVLITRDWSTPRSATLAITVAATVIWPLSGHAWLVAPLAFIVIGALLAHDRRNPTRTPPRLDALLVLGLGGAIFMLAGAFTARPKPDSPAAQPPVATLTVADEDADEASKEAPEPRRKPQRRAKKPKAEPAGGATPQAADAPAPTSAVATPDAPGLEPEQFVRDYYADLDARRFDEAWETLSPAVQASLGPYARWKAGYAGTRSSTPQAFSVEGGSVTHMLVARDKGCDRARQFRVTWQLVADGSTWAVSRLAATAVGPQEC